MSNVISFPTKPKEPDVLIVSVAKEGDSSEEHF